MDFEKAHQVAMASDNVYFHQTYESSKTSPSLVWIEKFTSKSVVTPLSVA